MDAGPQHHNAVLCDAVAQLVDRGQLHHHLNQGGGVASKREASYIELKCITPAKKMKTNTKKKEKILPEQPVDGEVDPGQGVELDLESDTCRDHCEEPPVLSPHIPPQTSSIVQEPCTTPWPPRPSPASPSSPVQ